MNRHDRLATVFVLIQAHIEEEQIAIAFALFEKVVEAEILKSKEKGTWSN